MKKSRMLFFVVLLVLGLTAIPSVGNAQQERNLETVYDVIKGDERLVSFARLVDAAALADNLDHDGPFTVFAPTNTAWALLEAQAVETDATLTDILLYHVINGNYSAPNVANRDSLPTLLGEHVYFTVQQGAIMLNDSVKVTVTDMVAANGVVHVVDAVLIPPVNSLRTSPLGSSEQTIVEVLTKEGNFETFLALAEQAGLLDMLDDSHAGYYTLFAPTDEAFANASEDMVAEWLADPSESLKTILLYHIVGDHLGINQLATINAFVPTLEGRALLVTTDENIQVYVNGFPIQTFNIRAVNGVIHTVDQVLTP
ncbi:MAG: fasciclin domain-containing protein [Anaerolineae bacterium]|nr:fasciclin domain-containing protein [Anaerolineae bacterium]